MSIATPATRPANSGRATASSTAATSWTIWSGLISLRPCALVRNEWSTLMRVRTMGRPVASKMPPRVPVEPMSRARTNGSTALPAGTANDSAMFVSGGVHTRC